MTPPKPHPFFAKPRWGKPSRTIKSLLRKYGEVEECGGQILVGYHKQPLDREKAGAAEVRGHGPAAPATKERGV